MYLQQVILVAQVCCCCHRLQLFCDTSWVRSFSILISFKLKLQFQASMSTPAMFPERSCKHAKMFACTEPESEDFAYWDDHGMKVLHCDHTFELRSQQSSLLLHQEGQGRRSSLIVCFASYRKGCHVALHEGNNLGILPVSCIPSCS